MNMKNVLILILTIIVAATMFAFAGANAETCTHTNTDTWWTKNATSHKKIITCRDCKTTVYDDSKFDPHVFVKGVCECGYKDPDYVEPKHEHTWQIKVINDCEYYKVCTCGEKTKTEVFEWNLFFQKGRSVIYKDATTGYEKHYSDNVSIIGDNKDHKISYSNYVSGTGTAGIVWLDYGEYNEPHNLTKSYDEGLEMWIYTCDDCGFTAECHEDEYIFKTRVLGISYYEARTSSAHYYRYTTDEGEILFFSNIFDAYESKYNCELTGFQRYVLDEIRTTYCEKF